jgi:hypothetical protein
MLAVGVSAAGICPSHAGASPVRTASASCRAASIPAPGREQCEFLAADTPRDHVRRADPPDVRAEGGDDCVADRMAVGVVDRLEPVEVGDEQRRGARLVMAAAQRRARRRLEPAAVEQARQRIAFRLGAKLGEKVDRDRDHQAVRR